MDSKLHKTIDFWWKLLFSSVIIHFPRIQLVRWFLSASLMSRVWACEKCEIYLTAIHKMAVLPPSFQDQLSVSCLHSMWILNIALCMQLGCTVYYRREKMYSVHSINHYSWQWEFMGTFGKYVGLWIIAIQFPIFWIIKKRADNTGAQLFYGNLALGCD